jgi:hypothetical protein
MCIGVEPRLPEGGIFHKLRSIKVSIILKLRITEIDILELGFFKNNNVVVFRSSEVGGFVELGTLKVGLFTKLSFYKVGVSIELRSFEACKSIELRSTEVNFFIKNYFCEICVAFYYRIYYRNCKSNNKSFAVFWQLTNIEIAFDDNVIAFYRLTFLDLGKNLTGWNLFEAT